MSEEMQYCKRLIEVDLTIKRISAHARREKSIRHGHISTLHIWWARRPLAACRAVLCASLWPDPVDPLCPDEFREVAREEMVTWAKKHITLLSTESFNRFVKIQKDQRLLADDLELRKALLDFIADFSNWDNSTDAQFLETSRHLTQVAHESLGGIAGTRPMVVDSFAGGGSIPLEALRVGADAFASDLNPVAVLLNKVVLKYIPRYGEELAEEVRKWGEWIKKEAEKQLAEFYPKDSCGATPIAYLWVRTICCEGPGCGTEVPLMSSPWLAKKKNRSIAVKMIPNHREKKVDFEIVENIKAREVGEGTVKRGSATCPVCGYTTPAASIRRQLKERHGGANDARLFCVVTAHPGQQGRFYRLPNTHDMDAVKKAHQELERQSAEYKGELSLVPNEPYPDETASGALSSSVLYGHTTWGDIFTQRQLLTLTTLVKLIKLLEEKVEDNNTDYVLACQTCLAFAVDRHANTETSLSRWNKVGEKIEGVFSRQALPMVWDFCEANPFSTATGSLKGAIDWVYQVCHTESVLKILECNGDAIMSLSQNHPLPNDFAQCFFTDPPYYDAIAYGDLSDFFYVWLKRSIGNKYPSLFSTQLVNTEDEIVQLSKRFRGPYAHKTKEYFESGMACSLAEGRRIVMPDGIGVVVFAHKSTEGWEAQLQAMVDAGWIVTASWPIDTEMGTRMNAQGTASLASSIHLVCRPRENPDGSLRTDLIGDWRDVLQELPKRIHEWMPRLAENGVVGADAIFACLGPALEVFSRYSVVEKPNGDLVSLREYMEHVWAAISREALSVVFSEADASGFEEDSRLTAIWLWTLSTAQGKDDLDSKVTVALNRDDPSEDESSNDEKPASKTKSSGYLLEYDTARKIAQGLGAHLDKLNSIVEIKGDTARLLPVEDRARYLFGKTEEPVAVKKKAKAKQAQPSLFDLTEDFEKGDSPVEPGMRQVGTPLAGTTVLDRVHQSMLLFATGRAEALKRFLVEDGIGHDQRFWKLAQALSALYPPASDEKRWVDGVLARKKGLGL